MGCIVVSSLIYGVCSIGVVVVLAIIGIWVVLAIVLVVVLNLLVILFGLGGLLRHIHSGFHFFIHLLLMFVFFNHCTDNE